MTLEEFDKTYFCAGMSAMYKGELVAISSVNFEEKLLEVVDLANAQPEPDDFYWVRCESVEMAK